MMRGEAGRLRCLTGGYYWFPIPGDGLLSWEVLSCHELGHDAEVGHTDLWRSVIDRLAEVWCKDPRILGRRLRLSYTGLPRGRITRLKGRSLILHGRDATVSDWRAQVLRRFQLNRRSVRLSHSEHERTFTQHRTTVFAEFGLPELSAHRRVGERRQ